MTDVEAPGWTNNTAPSAAAAAAAVAGREGGSEAAVTSVKAGRLIACP